MSWLGLWDIPCNGSVTPSGTPPGLVAGSYPLGQQNPLAVYTHPDTVQLHLYHLSAQSLTFMTNLSSHRKLAKMQYLINLFSQTTAHKEQLAGL